MNWKKTLRLKTSRDCIELECDLTTMIGGYMPAYVTPRRLMIILATGLLAIATGAVVAQPQDPQLTSASAKELWKKGSNQILAGDFAAAAGTLRQAQKLDPNNTEVTSAVKWMRDAESLAESREVGLFAEGGRVTARVVEVWPLEP